MESIRVSLLYGLANFYFKLNINRPKFIAITPIIFMPDRPNPIACVSDKDRSISDVVVAQI